MKDLKYNRLLIIDGSHALHRSISEPHLWTMTNSKGERTGGIYGTLQTILKESSTYNYFPVVIFDGQLSKRRLSLYDNYKHWSDKQMLLESVEYPTELELLQAEQKVEYKRQREILKQLLPALGIPVIHLADWEGDDLIYILSTLTLDSVILSDDKDLLQLLYDDGTRRCRVRRGMRDEFLDKAYLAENGMTELDFIACKAIIGDQSDNIPSACYQVGEKTALPLYRIYTYCKEQEISFPTDEKSLTDICKKLNISKRKAYLNFDENIFLRNLLLVNLFIVENDIDDNVLNEIDNSIRATINEFDLDTLTNILNELEINRFDTQSLVQNVNTTKGNVYISSYDPSKSIPDLIPHKMGKLF